MGGIAFVGRQKCEKYPKNKRNLLLFGGGGGNSKLGGGGGIFPPKGHEKYTALDNPLSDWSLTITD